jgi:hypothetical protein
MKKDELSRIIYISIAISASLTLMYLLINSTYELIAFFRGASFSITVVTLFWTFYFAYGWRLYGFNQIFYRPDLNGTWKGSIISDWKDPNGNTIAPKEIYIVIRQNFLRIHFTTFTETFVGYSYSETFNLKKETGLKNVAYLYRKDTSQSNEDDLREGATELRLIHDNNFKKLDGKYWTNTKTQGKITVEFFNENHVDSFESAKKYEKIS